MLSLQSSHLPESAEILDILNQIEFEGLFYSHDKLAQLQVYYRGGSFGQKIESANPPLS
jgi:hypothetical protein